MLTLRPASPTFLVGPMSDWEDKTVPILVCLVAALDDFEMATNMDSAYVSKDPQERMLARFIDRFLAEAIEAGLVDAEGTWNKAAWEEAVKEVHG
jgi:hypothetical protein